MKDNLTTINTELKTNSISDKVWKQRFIEMEDKLKALLKGLEFEKIDKFVPTISVKQLEDIGRGLTKLIKKGDAVAKLKPCPFCGSTCLVSQRDTSSDYSTDDYWEIFCNADGCGQGAIRLDLGNVNEQQAINIWNTRSK